MEQVSTLTQVVDGLFFTAGLISPIKTPVNIIRKSVRAVRNANKRIQDQVERLDGTDDTSTPGVEANGG